MPKPRLSHIINNSVHIHEYQCLDIIHIYPLPTGKKCINPVFEFPTTTEIPDVTYIGNIKLSDNDITAYVTDNSASWFEREVKNSNREINASGVNIQTLVT
jgi:hypothetical protein